MPENQTTTAPGKSARTAVQGTKSDPSFPAKKRASAQRRSFANVEDVHDFVDEYLKEGSTAPDAALILLDERQELRTVEAVPTIPFLLREEGYWEGVYQREQQRYLQSLRKCALGHDAAAIVLAVKIFPIDHLKGTGLQLEDDRNLFESLQFFADELFLLLRGERVELLDVVTWQRDDEAPTYEGRRIESLYSLHWRPHGHPQRKSKDEADSLRILKSNMR